MKKGIILTVLGFFIVLIFCLGIYRYKTMESGDAPVWKDVDNIALGWGFNFASAIPEKPHIVDRSNAQYQIFKAYLELDMVDKAAEAAGQIADWHECLAYGDLAIHFAQKGQDDKVGFYLKNAQKCRSKLTDWQTSWQRDRISLDMAKARIISGQMGPVTKTGSGLSPESAGQFRVLLYSHIDGPGDYEESAKKLQAMENSELLEVRSDVARAYIEILRQLGVEATADQCTFLQMRVYDVSKKLPQLLEHNILCGLSRAAFSAGRKKMGRQVLVYAEKQLKSRQLKARFDVDSLTALAGIWDEDVGDHSRAESLLNEAEALLMKGNLKGMDQVKALVSLARGYAIHGNQETAWGYYRNALQTAGLQKNARPRAMAVTEICAAIARWRKPLPKDMAKEMARLYKALGDPW